MAKCSKAEAENCAAVENTGCAAPARFQMVLLRESGMAEPASRQRLPLWRRDQRQHGLQSPAPARLAQADATSASSKRDLAAQDAF